LLLEKDTEPVTEGRNGALRARTNDRPLSPALADGTPAAVSAELVDRLAKLRDRLALALAHPG
ncbi:MAG: hypothetical protein ACK4TG_10545, partial [Thermaurantiacus sp.]